VRGDFFAIGPKNGRVIAFPDGYRRVRPVRLFQHITDRRYDECSLAIEVRFLADNGWLIAAFMFQPKEYGVRARLAVSYSNTYFDRLVAGVRDVLRIQVNIYYGHGNACFEFL
jgi:hypothetical protein